MTSTGTTTAAQSVLSQRILDPFFPLFQALAKEIFARGACRTLTASSVFGPLAGVQRSRYRGTQENSGLGVPGRVRTLPPAARRIERIGRFRTAPRRLARAQDERGDFQRE